MDIIKKIAKQYNYYAENYFKSQIKFYNKNEDPTRKIMHKYMINLKNKYILDLGCGYGKDAYTFLKKGANVWGTDSSEEMIKLAKKNYPGPNYSVQYHENLKFNNNFFDIIYSRYTIDYSFDLSSVFNEIYKVLKQKGMFIFSIIHPTLLDKNCDGNGITYTPTFRSQCTLSKPYYKISDYINSHTLNKFELLDFVEGKEHPDKFKVSNKTKNIMDYAVFILKKR